MNLNNKNRILALLHEQFGRDLLAVVLFGSQVRGNSTAYSDIDILIILNNAPVQRRARRRLAAIIHRQLSLPIDATILNPETFSHSIQYCAPLMIELARAHEVWFEREGFFSKQINFIRSLVQQGALIELQAGVWKLSENLDEMAPDGFGIPA